MPEKHRIFGGKVTAYKRENSSVWQCSTSLQDRNHRVSTKEESLSRAKDFAEDWLLELRGKKARGELITEKTFRDAAEKFRSEYVAMTEGERKRCGTGSPQCSLGLPTSNQVRPRRMDTAKASMPVQG